MTNLATQRRQESKRATNTHRATVFDRHGGGSPSIVLTWVLAEICMSANAWVENKMSGKRTAAARGPIRKSGKGVCDLLAKYSVLFSKQQGPTSRNFEKESTVLDRLISLGETTSVEVRRWQDGTHSDFGVRPSGSVVDLWKPVQLKTTTRTTFPMVFKGISRCSSVDVLAVAGDDTAFLFDSRFVEEHRQDLQSNGSDRRKDTIKITSGMRGYCPWSVVSRASLEEALTRL